MGEGSHLAPPRTVSSNNFQPFQFDIKKRTGKKTVKQRERESY